MHLSSFKKLLISTISIFFTLCAFSQQNGIFSKVIVTNSFQLGNKIVYRISSDTTATSKNDSLLVTEAAAKKYADTKLNAATNVSGGTGVGLIKNTVGGHVFIKKLVSGSNISFTDLGDSIVIDASGGGGGSSITITGVLPIIVNNGASDHPSVLFDTTHHHTDVYNDNRFQFKGNYETFITAPYTTKKYWNGFKAFVTLNSDSLNEGSNNLFYLDSRARAAVSVLKSPLLYNNSTGVFDIDTTKEHTWGFYDSLYQRKGSYLTGNQSITLTVGGDVTGSANGTTSLAPTLILATVNSNVGTFNNVTVNAKGLVTSASNVSYLTGNQSITWTAGGDVTGSANGTTSISPTLTIANNAVTFAKFQNISTGMLLGRSTASTGLVEQITVGSGLSLVAGVLASTSAGGSVTNVSIVTADGLAGSVANATTTPTITLSTTVSGMVKGDGTSFTAAVAGVDYVTASSTNSFTNKSGNISQWTNNVGYITSYTENSTLANVTSRGNISADGLILTENGNASNSFGIKFKRNTDGGSPAGYFELGRNAADNSTLYSIDINGNITANSFIKSGGTSSQFLKADGSVDNGVYITGNQTISFSASGDVTGSSSSPTSLAPTLTLATVNSNVGTWNNVTVNGKGLVTAASNVAYLTSAVTSVGIQVPIGIGVSGSPITSSGNMILSFTTGATAGDLFFSSGGDGGGVTSRTNLHFDTVNSRLYVAANTGGASTDKFIVGGSIRIPVATSSFAYAISPTSGNSNTYTYQGSNWFIANNGLGWYNGTSGTTTTLRGYFSGTKGLDLMVASVPKLSLDSAGNVIVATLSGGGSKMVVTDNNGLLSTQTIPSGGAGTVTTLSVVSANGLAGTVANATTTPAITLSTTVTGILKGNGTTISAATAGTDYVASEIDPNSIHNQITQQASSNAHLSDSLFVDKKEYIGLSTADMSNVPTATNFNSVIDNSGSGLILTGMFRLNQTSANTSTPQALETYLKYSNTSGTIHNGLSMVANVELSNSASGIVDDVKALSGGIVVFGAGLDRHMVGVIGGLGTSNGGAHIGMAVSFQENVHIISNSGVVDTIVGVWLRTPTLSGGATIGTRFGIWQDDPAAINLFSGKIKIADGTQSNGYVLTSDANGLATWIAPGNYIKNQTSQQTSANFNIDGTGVMPYLYGSTATNGILIIGGTNSSSESTSTSEAVQIWGSTTSLGDPSKAISVLHNGTFRINKVPSTSSGSYDILTRNSSNGNVEKISTPLSGGVVAYNYGNGFSTAQSSFISYTDPGSLGGTYRIGAWLNVNSVSADVIQLRVTFTDVNNSSTTQTFVTTAGVSSISSSGKYVFAPIDIFMYSGTTITGVTVLTTSIGSINYDAGMSIQYLYPGNPL